jgi:hypothetical protein
VGLTLGVLAGLAVALVKMLGGRSEGPDEAPAGSGEPWPPLRPDQPAATPAPAVVAAPPVATPAPAVEPPAPAPAPAHLARPAAPAPAPAPAPAAVRPAAPQPAKAPAAKKAPKPKLVAAWVEPKGGVCPTSHPVKAKLTSKIFHLPGMLNYDRTNPDRCYKDAPSAEKDGLRPAKR